MVGFVWFSCWLGVLHNVIAHILLAFNASLTVVLSKQQGVERTALSGADRFDLIGIQAVGFLRVGDGLETFQRRQIIASPSPTR